MTTKIARSAFWRLMAGVTISSLVSLDNASAGLAPEGGKFLGSIWKNWNSADEVEPGFVELFNQTTPENYGKWGRVQPTSREEFDWSGLDAMHAFAEQKGLLVKQHAFVWGKQQPAWTESLASEQEAKAAVEAWIQAYFERYGTKTHMADVVNEPLHAVPGYAKHLGGEGETGWDWVIWTFETARKHAPDSCKLILNDYDLLKSSSNADKIVAIAKLLKARGLIDGIGAQSHFLEGTSASSVKKNLDNLASAGVPIYISELDIHIAGDQKQRDVYKSHFPVLWEHKSVKGITLWGYREGGMWRENGYLIRQDGSERPALQWLRGYLSKTTGIKTGAISPSLPAAAGWLRQADVSPRWFFGNRLLGRRMLDTESMQARK